MSKKSEDKQKKPYMYIVQPEISPPDPNMQSQFRSVVGEDDIKVVEVEDGAAVDEIRIISSESLDETEETMVASQNDELVVEMATAVVVKETEEESVPIKETKRKKKSFLEMSKEEIVHFLAKMPAAVPRPVCTITIDGEKFRGQFEKQKGELFLIRIQLEEGSELIRVRMEDIGGVEVENL